MGPIIEGNGGSQRKIRLKGRGEYILISYSMPELRQKREYIIMLGTATFKVFFLHLNWSKGTSN